MITSFEKLASIRKRHRDGKIVFAGGAFDLLHPGLITHLRGLREHGDIVVIAITSDIRVVEKRGIHRPIQPEFARCNLVDSLRFVDYTFIAPKPEPLKRPPTTRCIERLRPDTFVSSDQTWEEHRTEIESFGTKLVIETYRKSYSTERMATRLTK